MVDDGSQDGTAHVAAEAAEAVGAGERLTVLTGRPLPPGWTGKLWAVKQGVEAAGARARPKYLLLTDADIVYGAGRAQAPGRARRAAAHRADLAHGQAALRRASPSAA